MTQGIENPNRYEDFVQPQFRSAFQVEKQKFLIETHLPSKAVMNDIDPLVYGELLDWACGDIIDVLEPNRREEIRGLIGSRRRCDDRWGNFIIGLGTFIDVLTGKTEFLLAILILSIGGDLYGAGVLAWRLVELASDMAGELRSKAE